MCLLTLKQSIPWSKPRRSRGLGRASLIALLKLGAKLLCATMSGIGSMAISCVNKVYREGWVQDTNVDDIVVLTLSILLHSFSNKRK
jgi:hypothetical protein